MKPVQKIMIGGAQLGMPYGIANAHGQIDQQEALKIFQLAQSHGISQIDTAAAYGESEHVIGQFADSYFKVVTKLSSLPQDISSVSVFVRNNILSSLKNLQRESCEGLLVHQAQDLLGSHGPNLYDALCELKEEKKIKKIGVSVYSPEQIDALLSRYQLDIIQFPLNLFDQRFLKNQLLSKLKNINIELHARSIFLQGLLLMEEHRVPSHLNKALPLLQALRHDCEQNGFSVRQSLIEFITTISDVDYYIFGIDNSHQLSEIINDLSKNIENCGIQFESYACDDLSVINPMNWLRK